MSDPLSQVKLLMAAVKKRAEQHNLSLHNFVLIPGDEGEPDFVQMAMTINPEALETLEETEQRKTDDAFAALMSGIDLDGFEAEVPEEVRNRVANTASEILGEYGHDESDAAEDDNEPGEAAS